MGGSFEDDGEVRGRKEKGERRKEKGERRKEKGERKRV